MKPFYKRFSSEIIKLDKWSRLCAQWSQQTLFDLLLGKGIGSHEWDGDNASVHSAKQTRQQTWRASVSKLRARFLHPNWSSEDNLSIWKARTTTLLVISSDSEHYSTGRGPFSTHLGIWAERRILSTLLVLFHLKGDTVSYSLGSSKCNWVLKFCLKTYFYFLFMCFTCMYICALYAWYLKRFEVAIDSPETGVTDVANCHVDAGNLIQSSGRAASPSNCEAFLLLAPWVPIKLSWEC